MRKAGGGHTRHGIPFLRCLGCCSREAINRQKLREFHIFSIWREVLNLSINTTGPTTSLSESDELLLEAKRVILTSLTNFYYDEESLKDMLRHNYCSLISKHLPETLLHIKSVSEVAKEFIFNSAVSSDLPTFYDKLDTLPSRTAPATNLQIMKRLSSSGMSHHLHFV